MKILQKSAAMILAVVMIITLMPLIMPTESRAYGESQLVPEDIRGLNILGKELFTSNDDYELIYTGENLPKGVSYDLSSNTLTLNNANLVAPKTVTYEEDGDVEEYDFYEPIIQYYGDRTLTIKVLGKNVLKGRMEDGYYLNSGISVDGLAGINVVGSGSLEANNCLSLLYQEPQMDGESYDESINDYTNGDQGDINISGVKLKSNTEGIFSQFSNLTIEDSDVRINSKLSGYYLYGVKTGYSGVKGKLSVKNSTVEILGDPLLSYASINLNGEYLYAGDGSTIKRINTSKLSKTSYKQYVLDYEYTLITPENKGASFTRSGGKCTVKFNVNGGKAISKKSITVASGKKCGTLPVPKRSKYGFVGWYTKKSGGSKVTASTVVKKSMTLYAHWGKGGIITYKLNGGKNNKANKPDYLSSKGMTLKAPTRKAYKFLGWYKDKKFKTKITKIKKKTKGNITLYAKWQKHTIKITYKVKNTKKTHPVAALKIKKKMLTGKQYIFKGKSSDKKKVTWTSSNKMVMSITPDGLATANSEGKVKLTAKTSSGVTSTITLKTNGDNYTEVKPVVVGTKYAGVVQGEWKKLAEQNTDNGVRSHYGYHREKGWKFGFTTTMIDGSSKVKVPLIGNAVSAYGKVSYSKSDVTCYPDFLTYSKETKETRMLYGRDRYDGVNFTMKDYYYSKVSKEKLKAVNGKTYTVLAKYPRNMEPEDYRWVYGTTKKPAKDAKLPNTAFQRTIPVRSLYLDTTYIELIKGSPLAVQYQYKIKPFVLPADASNQKIKWSTSNAKVAAVNNGTISAAGVGTATITATTTDGSNQKATCTVVVSKATGKEDSSFISQGTVSNFKNIGTDAFLERAGYPVYINSYDERAGLLEENSKITKASVSFGIEPSIAGYLKFSKALSSIIDDNIKAGLSLTYTDEERTYILDDSEAFAQKSYVAPYLKKVYEVYSYDVEEKGMKAGQVGWTRKSSHQMVVWDASEKKGTFKDSFDKNDLKTVLTN